MHVHTCIHTYTHMFMHTQRDTRPVELLVPDHTIQRHAAAETMVSKQMSSHLAVPPVHFFAVSKGTAAAILGGLHCTSGSFRIGSVCKNKCIIIKLSTDLSVSLAPHQVCSDTATSRRRGKCKCRKPWPVEKRVSLVGLSHVTCSGSCFSKLP